MPRHPDQDADEGKRNVAIAMTNAVFSKLIKMGRELGKTPQRMAQELFEEAYAARCMGKAKPAGQVAIAGPMADLANAVDQDLLSQLSEARRTIAAHELQVSDLQRETLRLTGERNQARTVNAANCEQLAEARRERDVVTSVNDALRDQAKRMEATIASKDRMLLEQAAEIREMREAAKGQLVVVNQASEILRREAEKPIDAEPCWAQPPSAAQLRAIRAMKAASNSPAAIARQLGVSIETVRAALA